MLTSETDVTKVVLTSETDTIYLCRTSKAEIACKALDVSTVFSLDRRNTEKLIFAVRIEVSTFIAYRLENQKINSLRVQHGMQKQRLDIQFCLD